MLRVCRLGMLLALVLAGVRSAGAQQLRGHLLDLSSDEPIPLGMVTLRTLEGAIVAASVTDDEGRWDLRAPGQGQYLVSARRIGYQPWTAGPVVVNADEELTFHFHLRRLPAMLAPTEIVARSTQRNLELAGFYERQRSDFGFYLTPEVIEKRQAKRVSDLLLGLPGVHLVSSSSGSVGGMHIQLRAGNLSPGGVCRPRIYLDGIIFARGDARPVQDESGNIQATEYYVEEQLRRMDQAINLDDIGPPSDIAAIEVYRTATQVPVRFGGASIETACGVIVIWTRRGTPRGK